MVRQGKGDPFKAERDRHPTSQGVGNCNKITVLKKPKAKEAMALLEKIATVRLLRVCLGRAQVVDGCRDKLVHPSERTSLKYSSKPL